MNRSVRSSAKLETSFYGKGVCPYQHAGSLLNPLRRLILSPGLLVSRLHLEPEMTVLEIGAGPGYFSLDIARALPMGEVILFDIQEEMLHLAMGRLEKAGLHNYGTCCGHAGFLPFAGGTVDVAVLVTVLGEVTGREQCLAEIRRVLRPGGLLSISEQRGDPDYLAAGLVQRLVQEAGFTDHEVFRGLMHFTFNTRGPG